MPELPEVEHAARALRVTIVGRTITRVQVFHPALARVFPPKDQRALTGRKVKTVERKAKLQLLTLDNGSVLEVHFRMTGDWAFGDATDDVLPKERGRLDLDNGKRVSFIDPRAFGVLRLHAPGQLTLPDLGLEPLSDDFTGKVLREALASRRIPIKQALLDQKVLAGLGNIYTAESLWEAKLDPSLPANEVDLKTANRLVKAIRDVIERAPAGRYYYDGKGADEDHAWRVYKREGEPCMRCGAPIARVGQGGRSTYYCPNCQRSR